MTATAANLVGRTLGPYQLIERLEPDSPYTRFRAGDTRLFNQPVAVTILTTPPGVEAHRRFERAAEALVELRHPQILPLQDFGEQDGLCYVATPYLDSPTLAAFIGRGHPPQVEEALRLVALLADALDHAHRSGLAHGGVAPGAIYLTNLPPGREGLYAAWPLLADFGLTDIADGAVAAHPALAPYRPPEDLAGGNRARADIYALAATLAALLTGAPPDPREEERGWAALPSGIGAILRRALARDPAARFGSGAEFVLALQDALAPGGRGGDAAAELLAEARAAVTAGKFRLASEVYGAYLRLRPDDEPIRREFAAVESRRLERARRRPPPLGGAAPAPAAAPPAEPAPPEAGDDGPALRPILAPPPDEVGEDAGAEGGASRWNPFRRRARSGPDGPERRAAAGDAPARAPVSPIRAAPGVAPRLKPLVAPARERQRLVLPSALGALALIVLVVLGGTVLARCDGAANPAPTPSARAASTASPGAGGAGAPSPSRPLATGVPAIIPVLPTPSPTVVPPTPTAPLPAAVRQDNFSDPASGFPPQVEGREGSGYQNGEYAIIVPEPDGVAIADLAGQTYGDLIVQVDARAAGPSAGGSYGLVLRRQVRGGTIEQYFVLLDPEAGTLRLARWNGVESRDLAPPAAHPAIKRGEETNRLMVIADGGRLTVLVNGAQVAQASDPGNLLEGAIGLRADAGTAPFQARFSNLKIHPVR